MELDYPAIKALSSPTRIKILHRLLEKEATPTRLSEQLGKSKSTIVSHLTVLEDANLVDKDKEEGRRRVTYAPTRKARAIVEGRERTVKFSVVSSVLSAAIGAGIIGSWFFPANTYQSTGGKEATAMMAESLDGGAGGATDATVTTSDPGILSILLSQDALVAGAALLLFAICFGSLYYAWLLRPARHE